MAVSRVGAGFSLRNNVVRESLTLPKGKDMLKQGKIKLIAAVFCLLCISASVCVAAGEFKWARAKFDLKREVPDKWNVEMDLDKYFLAAFAKLSTMNVDQQVNVTSFENLEDVCQYPFVFMHAEGEPNFSEKEADNIRKYLDRGGFIFADDCVYQGKSDWFYQAMKSEVENKIYPGTKMVQLKDDHQMYHCLFQFPDGIPHMQGIRNGGRAVFDKKGRMKIFLCSDDLHCGWSPRYFGEEKCQDAIKMTININVYALTH